METSQLLIVDSNRFLKPQIIFESPEAELLSRLFDFLNFWEINRSVDFVVTSKAVSGPFLAFAHCEGRSAMTSKLLRNVHIC